MFKKNLLKDTGIEVIRKIEDEKIIDIVNQVSKKIIAAFPENNFNYLDIYKTLLDTPMYYAKIPEGLSKANYYYKDSSIYLAEETELTEIEEYIIHECIHKLQEIKDKKGKIIRLGICEVNELNVKAAALNEGAIQYVTTKALNMPEKQIEIYGIKMQSKTEYYPLLTNLINQIVHLIGEEVLIDSTINGNENFKIQIIDDIGESEYNIIEKNMNAILQAKNEIVKNQKSDNTQEDSYIRNLYFNTQNTIFTSYFNNRIKRIENEEEIKETRKKIISYKSIIGTNSEYDVFDSYYKEFEEKMTNKTPLMVVENNIFFKAIRKIRQWIFTKKTTYLYKNK